MYILKQYGIGRLSWLLLNFNGMSEPGLNQSNAGSTGSVPAQYRAIVATYLQRYYQ